MPRAKIIRSPVEEEIHARQLRARHAERNRLYRERLRVNNEPNGVTRTTQGRTRIANNSRRYRERLRNAERSIDEEVEFQRRRQERNTQTRYRFRNNNLGNHENDYNEHYLGEMNILCMYCNAKHFLDEKIINRGNSFNDCCSHGAVELEKIPDFPEYLHSMFDGSHDKSNLFFKKIRSYNSSYSFASFNANLINMPLRRQAPYCFKIQGQIYYQVNQALYPNLNQNPCYGQLFIADPEEAINYRAMSNVGVDNEILQNLERIMREINIFAQSYQMMQQEINHQRELYGTNTEPELQLLFTLKPGYDKNRYNFQRTNEIAAVFVTSADGDIPESYVTVRNKNTGVLQTISSMDPNVEPMVYPLFYPRGTQGWNKNLMRRNISRRRNTDENNDDYNHFEESNRRISRNAYVKYRIAIRANEFNAFLLGRRLFQQWIVDFYVKMERDRIQFCRDNQKQLRAESYAGLVDHMNNVANNMQSRVGKIVVLPSTFTGSPRYMMQNYQDSMAIVRSKGRPDLFITMTCNPNWREIKENLFPNQQASDRPDICARVFHLKKERLLNLITKRKFFGNVTAHVHVVEFQKRGLPHAHILLTLSHGYKFITPDIVNKFISCEIPDSQQDPELYNIVTRNMIHGPCDERCMVNGKCSKHYPKEFRNETTINADGYPHYQRRNNNQTINRHNQTIDNRYVVPYCPGLLKIFNCHINVEAVSSIKSVKYLYKYVYKGHDAANIIVEETSDGRVINHDEITNFIETRYVSPVEASYRILNKPLQSKSHSIIRLPVHLPKQQSILINDINDEISVTSALSKMTMLMDYFELNIRDENARQYLYMEIPSQYVFKEHSENGNKVHKWTQRRSHYNCIGRMFSVSPSQVELFRLRLLLLHIRGSTSFDDLKTVNGIQYNTFSDACLQLGLIENDDEWSRAMEEAITWMMPCSLRRLFVRILIHCQPLYPGKLWEDYKEFLSEDYNQNFHDSIRAENVAYGDICAMLNMEGQSITNYSSMPQIVVENNEVVNNECVNDLSILGNQQYNQLNCEQKEIVDIILRSCIHMNMQGPNCFYIDGPGGTGKTFIYNTIYNLLKSQNKKVCPMAFTGIAATLLPMGKTVHKVLGLPVPLLPDSSSNISVQSKEGIFLRDTDVFIWDEAPMAPRYALEIMDRTLRDVMNNDLPFGGKILVLGGDFRQLLPVLPHGTKSEIISLSIKKSILWNIFHKFHLIQNMRVSNEEISFAEFVLNVGNGNLNDNNDNIEIPDCCIINNIDIVECIYGNLIRNHQYDEMSSSAILSARNVDVDEINQSVVSLLDGNTERVYTSIDSADNCDDNGLMIETLLPDYLNTLNPLNLPPYELRLRINCIVMLIRNLGINEGLCNGTRLRILDLSNNLLKCKVLTGDKAGDIVFLNRITLYSEKEYPFTFKRRQFPIKLAFAMTINKAQGQTFSNIGIDLRRDVFTHGQLYVAISRVRSWNGLKIIFDNEKPNNKVKNYVFKEILQ